MDADFFTGCSVRNDADDADGKVMRRCRQGILREMGGVPDLLSGKTVILCQRTEFAYGVGTEGITVFGYVIGCGSGT